MEFSPIIISKEEGNDLDDKRHALEVATADIIKRHVNWEKISDDEKSEVARYYDDMNFKHELNKLIEKYLKLN